MNAHRASGELVSIIVPAFNAERWIDETLRSLRSQTYRNIEILVIDDGSRDRTPEIVEDHVSRDQRVKLIRQQNAGVAAARNRGMADARGTYISPHDADDLSAPTRIAELVASLQKAGPSAGVAYCWSSFIDEDSKTMAQPLTPDFEEDVRSALYSSNFVANGSAALMRAEALRAIGGYDPTLRDRKAQGCEDWAVLLSLAEHWHFVRVPKFLIGYRQTPTNMSSDRLQMLRSNELVIEKHSAKYPDSHTALRRSRKFARAATLEMAIHLRKLPLILQAAPRLAVTSPRWAFRLLRDGLRKRGPFSSEWAVFFDVIPQAERLPFSIGDPDKPL